MRKLHFAFPTQEQPFVLEASALPVAWSWRRDLDHVFMVVPIETSVDVPASMFLKMASRHYLYSQVLQDRGSESARYVPRLPYLTLPVLCFSIGHKFSVEGLRKGAHEIDEINKRQSKHDAINSRRTSP